MCFDSSDIGGQSLSSHTRKEIWGSCCVRCSNAASPWLQCSCGATFETVVASKSGTALLSCMWEHCSPKAENAVVLNRLFSDYIHGQLLSLNFGTAVAPYCGNAAFPKSCRPMHRARCGLLFNTTALPLGAAAAPNFFPCNAEMHRIIPYNSWYYTMQQFMVLYLDYCMV